MSLDISIIVWCDGEAPKSPNVYGTCAESIHSIFGPTGVLEKTSNRIEDQVDILNIEITDKMKKDKWVSHNDKVYCPS